MICMLPDGICYVCSPMDVFRSLEATRLSMHCPRDRELFVYNSLYWHLCVSQNFLTAERRLVLCQVAIYRCRFVSVFVYAKAHVSPDSRS